MNCRIHKSRNIGFNNFNCLSNHVRLMLESECSNFLLIIQYTVRINFLRLETYTKVHDRYIFVLLLACSHFCGISKTIIILLFILIVVSFFSNDAVSTTCIRLSVFSIRGVLNEGCFFPQNLQPSKGCTSYKTACLCKFKIETKL